MAVLDIRARYFGPRFISGEPRQIVIHSAECPMRAGMASSLAGGWWRNANNQTSAHAIADPRDLVEMVPVDERAWHCGTGNSTSLGVEHCAYARFTTAQWTTSDGNKMLHNSAQWVAGQCKRLDIPIRWLSLRELGNNEKGLCTHNDMRIVRGGTSHTDPGPGFPYAYYLGLVKEYSGGKPAPKPKTSYTKPPSVKFPLSRGEYFGNITGPRESHGGYYAYEKKYVKWIQVRLNELGYAPGGKWADGVYEQPTVDAVAKWQKARHAKTTSKPGKVYFDDWANLQKDR